jgi:hypothetical protein
MTNPTDREVLQFLLDSGEAKQANVKWGNSGYRNVIIFQGKKYQYKGTGNVNIILIKSILPLYISMSAKVKNTNKKDDEKENAVANIQQLYKTNKDKLKQQHAVQIIFSMRFGDEGVDRTYPDDVFQVTGGKGSIKKSNKGRSRKREGCSRRYI